MFIGLVTGVTPVHPPGYPHQSITPILRSVPYLSCKDFPAPTHVACCPVCRFLHVQPLLCTNLHKFASHDCMQNKDPSLSTTSVRASEQPKLGAATYWRAWEASLTTEALIFSPIQHSSLRPPTNSHHFAVNRTISHQYFFPFHNQVDPDYLLQRRTWKAGFFGLKKVPRFS